MDSDSPAGNEEVLVAVLRDWASSEPRLSLSLRFREASADSEGLLFEDDGSAFRLALPEPERGSESLDLPVHLLHILEYGQCGNI